MMPIRERRLLLSLQALRFYLSDLPGVLATAAFHVSVDLARRGSSSWFGDLWSALQTALYPAFPAHSLDFLLSIDNITGIEDSIRRQSILSVHKEVSECKRVPLLLPRSLRFLQVAMDGASPLPDAGAAMHEPFTYLIHVKAPKSRIALTQLRLAEHGLRCEMGRREGKPREGGRNCRLCGDGMETEMHVVFFCQGDASFQGIRAKVERVRAEEFGFLPSAIINGPLG